MVYTVIGISHRVGEFDGRAYDNYIVYATRDARTDKGEVGKIAEVFKVPSSNYREMSIGDQFDNAYYDRYQRIVGFNMV